MATATASRHACLAQESRRKDGKVLAIVVEGGKLAKISRAIEQGAMAFLLQEYKYVTLFALCFAALIASVIPHGTQTAIAFLAGADLFGSCAEATCAALVIGAAEGV